MHDLGRRRIELLDGPHELTVRALARTPDGFAVRYTATPPLPDDVSSAGPPLFLWLEGTDDLGNVYTDFGGAHGLSTDGLRTEGSVSGQPAVAAKAGRLTVRLVFLHGPSEHGYEFALPLTGEA